MASSPTSAISTHTKEPTNPQHHRHLVPCAAVNTSPAGSKPSLPHLSNVEKVFLQKVTPTHANFRAAHGHPLRCMPGPRTRPRHQRPSLRRQWLPATAPLEPRRAHVFRLKTGETIKAAGVFRAPLQAVTGQTQPRASAALLANSGDTDFRNTSRTWGWDFWWLQGFRHERIRVTSVLLG